MKITDDVRLIQKEFEQIGITTTYPHLRRTGKESTVIRYDDSDGTALCRFSDDICTWFPKSCVELEPQDEPSSFPSLADVDKEPMQILPDGTIAPVKTLRDEFAMAALGLMGGDVRWANAGEKYIAENAYEIADAMMEARKK